MFHHLTQRLKTVFDTLRSKGVLKEEHVNEALREIRIALLEADVALPAAKALMESIKEKAIGETVIKSITPVQLVIKLVHEGLIEFLSHDQEAIKFRTGQPTVMVMAGLQGSGKTTMSGKLAFLAKERGKKVLLVSLDTYRPAAQEQLALIGKSIGVDTLAILPDQSPLEIASRALTYQYSYDLTILDTAGRLHVQQQMMDELKAICKLSNPYEIFLVVDALQGQDAISTATAFHEALGITGVCLSRVDGDSRGGVALSLRHCTQCPIKIMGTGERPDQVMPFDARRLADRILDKGDIIGFVEKATQAMDIEEQEKASERMRKGLFTLEDLSKKLGQIESMGGLKSLLEFIPGMGAMKEKLKGPDTRRHRAIISSMTPYERRNPSVLNASRKRRVALGSGTSVQEINRLLQQFTQMQKMMKQLSNHGSNRGSSPRSRHSPGLGRGRGSHNK